MIGPAEQRMGADEKKIQVIRERMPNFLKIDRGGVFNFVLVDVGGHVYAIDDNYIKTDIMPINYFKLTERQENGLHLIKNQRGTKYGQRVFDHEVLPVSLPEILGVGESIDPENSYYILLKREETDIPKKKKGEVDPKTGECPQINFSLALIVNSRPDFRKFRLKDITTSPMHYFPVSILLQNETKDAAKDEIIPIMDLGTLLKDSAAKFCKAHPELKEYYPNSDTFIYAKYR